jgi:hypothetical protein
MIDLSYMFKDMTTRNMKATNPYSGESAMLTKEEFALYHLIKHAEETKQYDAMQKGLDMFSRKNPGAYMVLLD